MKFSIFLFLLQVVIANSAFCQGSESDLANVVPYVTTPQSVVNEMMKLADLSKDDVLFDLGSGDGRIPIAAAKYFGARAVGVELDSELVMLADSLASQEGVSDLVYFIQGDLFAVDFSEATVLVLYLWPDLNLKLRPKIQKMKSGTKIITHNYDVGDWDPDETITIEGEDGRIHKLFLWILK
ncbi:methyltransferase domain-containing protein [Belliella sp. R4-6]|uniref:Methyltransferase domain-containing protein n=1 Tax=Belliella alkalica TaxID=1730871 RepID=A0ABS9VG27_9BACT|nr:methyltransferase domain-containing protein [Belliella alkalica]MCH7415396.1 methyltransferase domain-containing protein [Belliella alkalica]